MAPSDPPNAPIPGDPSSLSEEDFGRSRTSLKKERVNNELALTELAEQLLLQHPSQLPHLGVSDDVAEALLALRKIKSFAARDRQLRLVRARLRTLDWMQIRAMIDRRRAGWVTPQAVSDQSEETKVWTEQLLIQKDEGLSRFVREYEHANRTRLRQLIRNVNQSGEAKKHKARQLLLAAVQEVLDIDARRRSDTEQEPV